MSASFRNDRKQVRVEIRGSLNDASGHRVREAMAGICIVAYEDSRSLKEGILGLADQTNGGIAAKPLTAL